MVEKISVGFGTDVQDENFAQEILDDVSNEFEADSRHRTIRINFWDIKTVIQDGYESHTGMSNEGLVFCGVVDTNPTLKEINEKADTLEDIRGYIREQYKDVTVRDIKTAVSYH